MSGKRTTMRKLRDVLRLRFQAGLSLRDISRSTKLSVGGVQKLIRRALDLAWPLPPECDDAAWPRCSIPAPIAPAVRAARSRTGSRCTRS